MYCEKDPTHMHHLVHQVCDGCRMDIYKVTRLLGHAKLVTTVLGTPQANAGADTCPLTRRAHVALTRHPARA